MFSTSSVQRRLSNRRYRIFDSIIFDKFYSVIAYSLISITGFIYIAYRILFLINILSLSFTLVILSVTLVSCIATYANLRDIKDKNDVEFIAVSVSLRDPYFRSIYNDRDYKIFEHIFGTVILYITTAMVNLSLIFLLTYFSTQAFKQLQS